MVAIAPGLIRAEVSRPDTEGRIRDGFLAFTTTAWLLYTQLYPQLHAAHLAIPACPFLTLTGHPCPFCGGTRSFSAMWRGDIGAAAHVFPIGPALFLASLAVAAYAIVALLSRRTLRVRLDRRLEKAITVVGVAAIGGSWALKLLWLGN